MKRLFLALLLVLTWAGKANAQGSFYRIGPFPQSGLAYVCPAPDGGTPCPSPSAIFSNATLTTAISNPIYVPQGATISFYIAGGQYTIQFPVSGYNQIVTIGSGGGITSVPSLPGTCTANTQYVLPNGTIGTCNATGNGYSGPIKLIDVTNPATFGGTVGASPSLTDNASVFATVMTAANNANLVGTPTYQTGGSAARLTTGAALTVPLTSGTAVATIGDTACFYAGGIGAGRTFTVTGTASVFLPVAAQVASGVLWCTAPGGIVDAFTSLTITNSSAADEWSATVATFRNVGTLRVIASNNTNGTSTTVSFTQTNIDTNNLMAAFQSYAGGVNETLTAGTGVLGTQVTSNQVAGSWGNGVITLAAPTIASQVVTANFTGSSSYVQFGLELRSRTLSLSKVVIPGGANNGGSQYIYSSGLNFTQPGELQCPWGQATLDYIGNAHAVDLGSGANALIFPFFVEGCMFTGGQNMTQGITINPNNIMTGISYVLFKNFGNSTAYAIAALQTNWDIDIGPQVKFWSYDGLPRNFFKNNINGADSISFVRMLDVVNACWTGDVPGTNGCAAAQAGVGVWINGVSTIEGSNIAFMNPDVVIDNSNTSYGVSIVNNLFQPTADGTTCDIQFIGTSGIGNSLTIISDNKFSDLGNAPSSICPRTGSDFISGLRVSDNIFVVHADANPVVKLNNLTAQTGNQASFNRCATGVATVGHACPIMHTTGSNIGPWESNLDDGLQATGQAPTLTGTGACATITTQSGSWAGQATCTGTTGASTFIITPGFTAPHGWQCDSSDVTHTLAGSQSAVSATACTITFSSVTTSDVITFKAVAY